MRKIVATHMIVLHIGLTSSIRFEARTSYSRGVAPIGGGHFVLPIQGQLLSTHVASVLSWQLDNPVDVQSQDLLLWQYQVAKRSYDLGDALRVKADSVVNAPRWTSNNIQCSAIEDTLRVSENCGRGRSNFTKAAIDYCDPNAHRMYIPTLADTTGLLSDGVTSDLFVTVWQYTGGDSIVTSRVLTSPPPGPYSGGYRHKYVVCASTDGHGRAFITGYVVTVGFYADGSPLPPDYNRAQPASFQIDPLTGSSLGGAFITMQLPTNATAPNNPTFLGDYIYTQASYDSSNGGSIAPIVTYSDSRDPCNIKYFLIVEAVFR
jgi:hypothetical protein